MSALKRAKEKREKYERQTKPDRASRRGFAA
jgi:hypothetical protein